MLASVRCFENTLHRQRLSRSTQERVLPAQPRTKTTTDVATTDLLCVKVRTK